MRRPGTGWARRISLVAAVVVAVLVAILPAGPWLIRERSLDQPDAILVLGSHESERLPHAARLARQYPDAEVLLTQPVTPTPWNCQDCAHRGLTLERAGVAGSRIRLLEPRVRTTFDEMRSVGQWMAGTRHRRLLVVTSPYHTRRVLMLAAAVVPDAQIGVSACPVPGGLAWPWWSRRYDRRYVTYEVAALMNNAWRHGIGPRLWVVEWTAPRV